MSLWIHTACELPSCMGRVRSAWDQTEPSVALMSSTGCRFSGAAALLRIYRLTNVLNKKNTCQRLCMSVFMMIDVCEIWYYCRARRWFSVLFITGLWRLWLINTESEETVTTGLHTSLSLIRSLSAYSLCPSFLLWYFLFSILLCFTAFFFSSLAFLSSLRP